MRQRDTHIHICFIEFSLWSYSLNPSWMALWRECLQHPSINSLEYSIQSLVRRRLLGWHLVHWQVSHTNWQSLEKQVSCCVLLWTFVTYSQRCQLSFEQTNTSIQFHQLVVLLFLSLDQYLTHSTMFEKWFLSMVTPYCTQVEFQCVDHFSIIWLPNVKKKKNTTRWLLAITKDICAFFSSKRLSK